MIMPFAQENTRKYYADNRELAEDIAAGYKKFIADVSEKYKNDIGYEAQFYKTSVENGAQELK